MPISSIADKSTIQSRVLAAEPPAESQRIDPDDALRAAIKAAVDAGDVDRAAALLEVLRRSPKPAPVVPIATARRGR